MEFVRRPSTYHSQSRPATIELAGWSITGGLEASDIAYYIVENLVGRRGNEYSASLHVVIRVDSTTRIPPE